MLPGRGPKKVFWLAFTWLPCCAHVVVWNLTSAAVLPRRNQDVQFYCGAACETLLELKLARDCASPGGAATHLRLGQEAGVRWARLDASSLTAGMHYSVCLSRVDTAAFEDTGETVFVSPIQEVQPLMVQPSSSQEFSITCVPGCTSSTELFLALDCADRTGAPRAALTGFRRFWSVTMDLSSLSFGLYKICADIDGAGASVLLAGDTGLSLRTAGPTSVQVVSIVGAPSQRLPLSCSGCSRSTALYLLDTGSACSSENTGLHLGTAPTSTSSVLLTGAGSQWDAIIDATSMTTGKDYKLCVDLDGLSRELAFVDTGLTVQITSITGVVSATFHVGGATDLELTTDLSDGSLPNAYAYVGAECSTAFSSSAGERNTVEQTVLGVVNGVISFPLVVTGLVQGKFYRACIDEDGPNAQGFVDVGVPIYVTGVTAVTPSGVARATNQQLEVICDPCSTSTMLYLTSTSCSALITNGDPEVLSGEDIERQTIATAIAAGTAVNLWTWAVDATSLAPGRQFHVCADVDGAGPYPFGDTALRIYTSPFSEVVTKGINVAELQTVYVRCATGCSETARAYLALRSNTPSNLFVKECDSSVTEGYMASYGNENTGSVSLVHKSGDLWAIENIDATSLIAGRYYGICVDMDGAVSTLGFGDTGFMIYVSGLEGISPSAIRQEFAQEIQLTCPYCNPGNDITQGYISLECDITLYFGFDLPATAGVNSPTNRLPGPGGVTSADATKLYIDARELDLGGVYHLCMDLDGSNAKMGMGDTSFFVYVTTMTAINPWGILPAQNQTVVMTCPTGCSDASAAYVGSYCDETVSNGEMKAVTGERTAHGSFTKPSTLPTDDYEVMLDAEGMTPGKHYSLCTDLDGSNTHLPWGNADLPIYISPVNKTWYNGFYSSATAELRLNCERCSIESRVYIIDEQYFCDHLDFGGQKTGSADQSSSVATTPLGGTAGVVLAFLDSTALTPGLRFRICMDLDGVATDYSFGDTGLQVYMASVTASGGTISAAAGQVLTITCSGCSTDTMAYLAINCDGTIADGSIAATFMNTAAVNLAGASPEWTATIDASHLQAGRHYTLCTDLDGSTGTKPMGANDLFWYVTGPGVTQALHE
ncbi:Hypothetical protein (Fragment) [Durusdinium trenchii]|uniref:Uncharacterized protein n=1 Tax=Durusdinium trenchii TaxID=1381693 RepID=A0ABP0PV44_9DINO